MEKGKTKKGTYTAEDFRSRVKRILAQKSGKELKGTDKTPTKQELKERFRFRRS